MIPSLFSAFTRFEDKPVLRPSWAPAVAAAMFGVLCALSASALGSAGLVAATVLGAAASWNLARNHAPFGSAPLRRLACVAPFAALGPLVFAAVAGFAPQACASLGAGVFLLMWPFSVFGIVLGSRFAITTSRREGWTGIDAPTSSLWGLFGAGLGIQLAATASWACASGGVLWGAVWFPAVFAALALSALGEASIAKR